MLRLSTADQNYAYKNSPALLSNLNHSELQKHYHTVENIHAKSDAP